MLLKEKLTKLANEHNVDPDKVLAIFKEAYRQGLIDRTYVKPEPEIDVDAYRALFSKDGRGKVGLKPGLLGDREFIRKKLIKWFASNPQFTMKDVLEATQYYVSKHVRENKITYIMQADYFIQKNGRSHLAAIIGEYLHYKEQEDLIVNMDTHDWTEEIV